MNLKNITLVVHDFGGPIGLGAAIQNDKRINKIILFNTWLWSTKENKEAIKINKIVNSWFGKFMYLRLNVSPKYLLKRGFENKKNLPKSVHRQYVKPFPDKKSRKPLLDLATELVGSSDWYQKQWEQLNELEQKKWLILWGIKDDFITQTYLQKWKKKLPEASVKKYECGHFVQEEATEESIQEMEKFLSDKRN